MVTRQLQVERGTGKVRRSKTNVLTTVPRNQPTAVFFLAHYEATAEKSSFSLTAVCVYSDILIVVYCLIDYALFLVLATYEGFPGAKVLRLAKLFRVIRSLRAVRLLRTIRSPVSLSFN